MIVLNLNGLKNNLEFEPSILNLSPSDKKFNEHFFGQ